MGASAGYKAALEIAKVSTAMVDEPMSQSGATKTYYTTDASKNCWDAEVATVIEDSGVIVDPSNYTLDQLMGKVTFVSGYTVNGAVTVSGSYLVRHPVGYCRGAELQVSRGMLDASDWDAGHVKRVVSLGDVAITLERLKLADDLDPGAGSLKITDLLGDGEFFVITFTPDEDEDYEERLRCVIESRNASAQVAALITSAVSFKGTATTYQKTSWSYGDPTA